jgi:hypothetical protein
MTNDFLSCDVHQCKCETHIDVAMAPVGATAIPHIAHKRQIGSVALLQKTFYCSSEQR